MSSSLEHDLAVGFVVVGVHSLMTVPAYSSVWTTQRGVSFSSPFNLISFHEFRWALVRFIAGTSDFDPILIAQIYSGTAYVSVAVWALSDHYDTIELSHQYSITLLFLLFLQVQFPQHRRALQRASSLVLLFFPSSFSSEFFALVRLMASRGVEKGGDREDQG